MLADPTIKPIPPSTVPENPANPNSPIGALCWSVVEVLNSAAGVVALEIRQSYGEDIDDLLAPSLTELDKAFVDAVAVLSEVKGEVPENVLPFYEHFLGEIEVAAQMNVGRTISPTDLGAVVTDLKPLSDIGGYPRLDEFEELAETNPDACGSVEDRTLNG